MGSAQFVTDWTGRQYEHIEYTPYGELWIEETAPGIDKLPFRFTGKELDEETGLYYYGARYLDPRYSRWLSGDPALGEYIPVAPINDQAKKHNENLPGMGGVFNAINLQLYHYAGNNPVKYVDPDGRIINLSSNVTAGNGLKQSQTEASIVKRTAGLFLIGLGLLLDYGSPLITGFLVYSSGGTTVAAAPAINAGSKALGKTLELAGATLYLSSTFDDKNSNNKRNSYREKTRGANQRDRQQIESVAKKYKIDKHSFGDFVENIKQSEGKGPSYTYKYSELEDLAKQFKELQP